MLCVIIVFYPLDATIFKLILALNLIQIHINVTADCCHRFYFIFQIFLTSTTQFQAIHIQ